MGKLIDITGNIYNKLKVISYAGKTKSRKSLWLCECECGSKTIVAGSNLKNGHTQSCGCLQKEVMSDIKKKYNIYNLSGEYGIGYTSNTNEPFYFDLEDYDLIKGYCWSKDYNGYIYTRDSNNQKIIYIHRLIMNYPKNMDVDHKFHDKFDNRKEFLRITTTSQNCMNSELSLNNTSGVTGVSWNNKRETWESHIGVENKKINLGYYDNFDEAVQVRKDAELKYFGEYTYTQR